MDRKLIASDIDGTLLFDKGTSMTAADMYVKDVDLQALATLKDVGTKVAICSGRPRVGIEEFLAIAGVTFDYYIATNGSLIYDKDWQIIYEKNMSHALAVEIVETVLAHAQDVQISGFTESDVYNFWLGVDEEQELQGLAAMSTKNSLEDLRNTPRQYVEFAMHFTTGTKEDKLVRMMEFAEMMQEHFAGRLEVYRNSIYLDITALGASKGKAIHQLAEHIGVHGDNTVAIGDGWNDLSMLQEAGVSYTFHHAEEDLKQHATHVVETFAEMTEDLMQKA